MAFDTVAVRERGREAGGDLGHGAKMQPAVSGRQQGPRAAAAQARARLMSNVTPKELQVSAPSAQPYGPAPTQQIRQRVEHAHIRQKLVTVPTVIAQHGRLR